MRIMSVSHAAVFVGRHRTLSSSPTRRWASPSTFPNNACSSTRRYGLDGTDARIPSPPNPSFFSVMSPPQAISSAVEDIPKCSVMLATGPDMAAAEMVKSIRERWNVRFKGAIVYF